MFDVRSGKLADSALLAGESHCFSLAVSTRGDFVAAGYSNGVVRSFAISKIGGVPRIVGEHIFTAHVGAVNSLCFISDGRLATCGDDGGIRIWPPFDGAYAAAGPDHITLQSIQLAARSAQDLRAVVHSYPEQKIWIGDVSQDQWKELSLPASPTHAAFHPHHPIVYYGTASGQVVAIDETTTKINRITRLGAEGVTWLHLTSNGRRIVAVLPRGRDDTAQIVVLDAETLAELRRADLPGHPLCAAISPTGHQIAYGGQEKNQIFIVDLATLDVEQEIEASHVVRAVHWQTAVELVSGYQDGTLTVWDVRSAKPIRTLVGHRGCIRSITSSPDGRTLVTTADDGTVRLWRIRDGVYLGTLVDHQRPLGFSSAAFSKDGHFLAVTRLDPTQPKNILLFRFGPNTRQLRRTVR
jgi:WD40 repeat protein